MSEVLSTNKIMSSRTCTKIATGSNAKQQKLRLMRQHTYMTRRINSRIFHLYYSRGRYVCIHLLKVLKRVSFCMFLILGISGSDCALIQKSNSLNLPSCPDYDTTLWDLEENRHCTSPERLHCQTDEYQHIKSMCYQPSKCGAGTYAKLDVAGKSVSCEHCPDDQFQPSGQYSYKYKRPSCERNRTPCSHRRGTSECEKGNASTDDKCFCDKTKGYTSQPVKGCGCFAFDDPCACSQIEDLCGEGKTVDEENNCIRVIPSTTPTTTHSSNFSGGVTQKPAIRSTTEPAATPGDSTLSTGAVVGIAIGIVIGIVVIIVIICLCRYKIRCFEYVRKRYLNKGLVSERESSAAEEPLGVTEEEESLKRPTKEQGNGVLSELHVSSPSNGYLSDEAKKRSSQEPLIGGSNKPTKFVFKTISVSSGKSILQIGNHNIMNTTAVEESDGSDIDDKDMNTVDLDKDSGGDHSDQTHRKTVADEDDTMPKKYITLETCPDMIVSMDEQPTTGTIDHLVPPKLPGGSDQTHRKMANVDADETKLKQVIDNEKTCPKSLVSMNTHPKPTANGSMASPKHRLPNAAVDADETELKRFVNTSKASPKGFIRTEVQPRENNFNPTDSDQTGLIVV